MLRELDARHPALSEWVGGRLDIEVPAILASLGVHAALLLVLATVGYAVHTEAHHEFQSMVGEKAISNELTSSDFQDLDQTADPPALTPAAGSFSPNLATTTVSSPPSALARSADGAGAARAVELSALNVRRAADVMVPSASMLGQTVSIKGNGAEHVGDVEGAVDRIAIEVLRRLEKGRTLVVWAFDASGSLQVERERLVKHIDAVYAHIAQLDEQSLASDDGLLTAVVAFGHDRKAMTTEPTADKGAIVSAIESVPLDTTGVETTFQTVAEIVRRWGRYKDAQGHPYHPMVIVVTDEVGDDEAHLEEAIDVASRAKVPVYVLGSQAIFGRDMGYMDYTDPATKQTFRHLPVRQGPESATLEQIRLPFWYDGPQYDTLDAGFGPYALSRLAGATGGIYFVTRLGPGRMGFDPVMMREYKPDWVSRKQYEANLSKSPIRQAVLEASQITQQQLPGQPPLSFPAADGPEFKEAMAKAQEVAARTAYTVDAAIEPVMRVTQARDRETSRRWQAHYDLVLGRLLAMKIRCYEYNWACAKMKKDAPKFQKPDSNAWRLVPDREIHYSDKASAAAEEARTVLKRVVEEHPGTPWALLAQRELKDPFGFKWVETHVRPIERNNSAAAAAKKKKAMTKPATKPAEPPKL
jgi:Mg-chelatase subunit ChlD